MSCDVSLVRCTDYEIDHIRAALDRLLAPLGGLDWVTPASETSGKKHTHGRL